MDLSNLLNGPLGETIINNISGQLGTGQSQTKDAIMAAIPAILGGLTKNAQTESGAKSLDAALESKHDGSLLDNLSELFGGGDTSDLAQDGENILEHIFGNKTSNVSKSVSRQSGLSTSQTSSLLAILAPIVMAYIGRQKKDNNVDSSGLGGLLGGLLGENGTSSAGGGLLSSLLGGIFGGNSGGSGNILGSILGMFTKK